MSLPILSNSVARAHRFLFGVDLFLSYARIDSTAYVQALAYDLSAPPDKLSCGFDHWETLPGTTPPASLLRSAANASGLIVVASPAALSSAAVDQEVTAFISKPGPIVIVTFDGVRASDAIWYWRLSGVAEQRDPGGLIALAEGSPHESVMKRARATCEYWKRNSRLKTTLSAGIAAFGIATTGAVIASIWAKREVERASSALVTAGVAQESAREAIILRRGAEKERAAAQSAANVAADRAERANALANQAQLRAQKADVMAALAARRASRAIAEVNRQEAVSRARQRLGRAADVMTRSGDVENWADMVAQALADAKSAIRELNEQGEPLNDTDEVYVRSVLGSLPRITRTRYSGVRAAQVSDDGRTLLGVSAQGEAQLWDLRSGELLPSPPEQFVTGPDLRSFAWNNSETELRVRWNGGEQHIISPDGRPVAPLAVGRGGAVLAFAYAKDDDTAVLYLSRINPARPAEKLCDAVLPVYRGIIGGVEFSADYTRLAARCLTGIGIWDVASGRSIATLSEPPGGSLIDLRFNRDGSRIALASVRHVSLWALGDLPTLLGQTQVVPDDEDEDLVSSIGLDAGGDLVAINIDDEAVFCVNPITGQNVAPQFASWQWEERGQYLPLRITRTATLRYTDRGVLFRDACTGRSIGRLTIPAGTTVSFAEDPGVAAAVVEDGDLFLADMVPPSVFAQLTQAGEVRRYLRAEDRSIQVLLSSDRLQVWNTSSGTSILDYRGKFNRSALDLAEDGQTLAMLDVDGVKVWRCIRSSTCTSLNTFHSPIRPNEREDGPYIITSSDHVLIFAGRRRQLLRITEDGLLERKPLPDLLPQFLATASDGTSIALLEDANRAIYAWALSSERETPRLISPARDAGYRSQFSYIGAADTVFVYPTSWIKTPDIAVRHPILDVGTLVDTRPNGEPNRQVALIRRNVIFQETSRDGRYMALAEDPRSSTPEPITPDTVEIVDIISGKIVAEIPLEARVAAMAFDKAGRLAIALNAKVRGESGFRLQVYEPLTWSKALDVHTASRVGCLAFGPGDFQLAAGQRDGVIVSFDKTGKQILSAAQGGTLADCAFVEGGQKLTTFGWTPRDGILQVIPASRAALVQRLMAAHAGLP